MYKVMEEKFKEVRNDFFDDLNNVICIDAWTTDVDDDEEGMVVATINPNTFEVIYLNDDAKRSALVHEIIKETLSNIINK